MENAGHGLADSITLFRSKLAVYKCDPSPGKDRRPAPQEPHSNHASQASTKSDTIPILQEPVTCTSNAGLDSDDEPTANPRKRSRRRTDASQETDRKSKKRKRGYAPPETYEHLHMLPDYLDQYLDVMFCGINPGCTSAEIGHHYAHATNHFWDSLHLSGLTDRLVPAEDDYRLPELYNYGLTNLVDRPSAEQSELSPAEMRAAVPDFMSKILKYRPRIVCFLARSIWDIFIKEVFRLSQAFLSPTVPETPTPPAKRSRRLNKEPSKLVTSRFFGSPDTDTQVSMSTSSPAKKPKKRGSRVQMPKYTFTWGLQPYKVVHRQIHETPPRIKETLFFVVPSPSARVVHYQWWDKVDKFKELKSCIDDVKALNVNTGSMHIVPSVHIASRSVYWLVPKDA